MHIIDSHFHTQILKERALETEPSFSFLSGGIDAGCNEEDLEARSALLSPYPHIKLAGAMGPWCLEGMTGTTQDHETMVRRLGVLEENLVRYRVSFLGETGLDYYWNYGTPELQKELFSKQMETAKRMGLRVLIHCRLAGDDTARIIREAALPGAGVIHCFEGSQVLLETALECGYWISYAGNLTYKSNNSLRETLKRVPADRLLLETDSPYLSPVPLRGQPNVPANVIHTYECAAQVLGISLQELSERVWKNYLDFTTPILGH